jgi:hypothetical protein
MGAVSPAKAVPAAAELPGPAPAAAEERIASPDRSLGRRRLERFLSELERMSPAERARASRYTFTRWERSVWAGRYPEEVPLVNGEFEWIALRCA